MTYAKSGVDIKKEERAIKELISSIKTQRKGFGASMGGHYAGMIDFGQFALVLCTDGVGSKVKIASELRKWDTVGIDCIAMNVNDSICVGAEPLAFVDYLAIDDPIPEITKEIGKGLAKGAELANISIVGGETASLPEIVTGFDLAGTCLAYVKKDKIVLGEKISPGDKIIGLSSSGIHSNGYTLVRKVIEKSGFSLKKEFSDKNTLGEELLTPTQIYVKEIVALLKETKIHGIAHITGGGLLNLLRLNSKVKFVIDNELEPQPIFDFIQDNGKIEDKEMYQTFNMGMGMAIIVPSHSLNESIKILKRYTKSEVRLVGEIKSGKGVELTNKSLIF